MSFPPNTFGTQSGNVPASQLDQNFAACFPLASPIGPSIVGNQASGDGPNSNLTPAETYALLQPVIPWEVVSFQGGNQTVTLQCVMRYQPATSDVTIVQASCLSSAGVAATGNTTFNIFDNGVSIGTLFFPASGSTGNITISGSPYVLSQGHVLVIDGPATKDVTLANINITLGGFRS